MHILVVAAPAFVASVVEFVEALTIVLAVGMTRQWRSTLIGVGAAVATLVVIVGVFGTAIVLFVPIEILRLVVGGFLLVFGLQWVCKATLRAVGARAKHDEAAIYERELALLSQEPPGATVGMDWISFTVAFKGVLLEGLEVAFIVLTFGSTQGSIPLAAGGAAAALVVVAGAGVLVRAPLAAVPENTLKFAVGVMLTTFGTFWAAEGAGADWPGSDVAILGVLAFVIAISAGLVALLRRRSPEPAVVAVS